jgi:hypothetical protein
MFIKDRPKEYINEFFFIQCLSPGCVVELPSSTNWMKLWKYITLELKQSSIWFIPNFKEEIFEKVFQKRWSKGDMERILKRDYYFNNYNDGDILSIPATLYSDLEKYKKDWLVIKSAPIFAEPNQERIQKIAKDLNVRVILIEKQ